MAVFTLGQAPLAFGDIFLAVAHERLAVVQLLRARGKLVLGDGDPVCARIQLGTQPVEVGANAVEIGRLGRVRLLDLGQLLPLRVQGLLKLGQPRTRLARRLTPDRLLLLEASGLGAQLVLSLVELALPLGEPGLELTQLAAGSGELALAVGKLGGAASQGLRLLGDRALQCLEPGTGL